MILATLTITAAFCAAGWNQDAGTEGWWDAEMEAALERAGPRRELWEAEARACREAYRESFAYLVAHMPQRDLDQLDPAFVTENVELALRARAVVPWGSELSDELFLDCVLPYAHVSEAREPWRAEFLERFLPAVATCRTPGEAAQLLNGRIFGELGVRYSTGRKRADQAPSESIEQGMASCTGLSILLADACRAVCVPARLAGIPSWPNKRGNHTWVEVWDDGWHFTGAAEPDGRGLDHAWFEGDAALAKPGDPKHAIYAVSWKPTGLSFPMVWAEGEPAHGLDVTERYLPEVAPAGGARLMVEVTDGERRIAVPVRVSYGELSYESLSHDESHDTNDLLEFEVPSQGEVEVALFSDGVWVRSVQVEFDGDGQHILRLRRPGPNAVGAMLRADAWRRYAAREEHAPRRADFDAQIVRTADRESPYTLKQVGDAPPEGFGLVIAMHGGGGAPKRVNDSQWEHMQIYYRDHPEHGGYLYCALRAPNDEWNGFYDDAIAPLVTELIEQLVLFADVDPNRVHLIGYSHGGYGSFVIGTKIPDRFASVHSSAAAPTDGETAGENLCATRFSYMVGEQDTAYGRHDRCVAFDELIRGIEVERELDYPVLFELKEGFGHGGLPDRDLLERQLAFVRDPVPRELVWRMTDDVLQDFFWLSVDEPQDGHIVAAACRDNRIELELDGPERVTLWLDERLVDLSKPVTIAVGERVATVMIEPDPETLDASLARRGDPELAFRARLGVDLAD